jgi:exodeoxyribonuclease VII small subunit
MDKEIFNFEEALKELENIVSALEAGKVSLEESLELYEKGIKLVKIANSLLTEAKNKLVNTSEIMTDE